MEDEKFPVHEKDKNQLLSEFSYLLDQEKTDEWIKLCQDTLSITGKTYEYIEKHNLIVKKNRQQIIDTLYTDLPNGVNVCRFLIAEYLY
jgi:hypothetical protein